MGSSVIFAIFDEVMLILHMGYVLFLLCMDVDRGGLIWHWDQVYGCFMG